MAHDPRAAILDMVQTIERAQRLASGLNEAGFLQDEPTRWAVFSQIVILGEAAGRVEEPFQHAHPEIPWSSVIGMRHRLVHGYDSVDWARVWKTLRDDLPPLLDRLRPLVSVGGSRGETSPDEGKKKFIAHLLQPARQSFGFRAAVRGAGSR